MKKNVSRVFNSTICSYSIAAAFDLGLLERLNEHSFVNISNFCIENDLHYDSVLSIIFTLTCFSIVKQEGDIVTKGDMFVETYAEKGYFLWLIGGYGDMLRNIAFLAKNKNRNVSTDNANFFKRDGEYIAKSGKDYGKNFVDEYFKKKFNNEKCLTICDLGCGSGDRLINLVKDNSKFQGIGVEIEREAIKLADSSIMRDGLSSRIKLIQSDIRVLSPAKEFEDVNVAFSFFMGHDLWPKQDCVDFLKNLLSVFPKMDRFFLCDTVRSEAEPSPFIPTFTLGFEVTHLIMGHYVPRKEEWMQAFDESGWVCNDVINIGVPYSMIFDLSPKKVVVAV